MLVPQPIRNSKQLSTNMEISSVPPRKHYLTSFEDVNRLACPSYKPLSSVSRCLHFDDVEETLKKGMLVPQPIRNSKQLSSNTKVLWFAPAQSVEEHNFYGNVSYIIDWQVLFKAMGPNLYLIDQAIYNKRGYTRILLTRRDYDNILPGVDLWDSGTSLLFDGSNYYHAETCECTRDRGPHELQIGIEASREDAEWIYENCAILANNHSSANREEMQSLTTHQGERRVYKSYKCFKFNTMQNLQCPFQLTKYQAEDQLEIKKVKLMSKGGRLSAALRVYQVPGDSYSNNDQNRAIGHGDDLSTNDTDLEPNTHLTDPQSADWWTSTARQRIHIVLFLLFKFIQLMIEIFVTCIMFVFKIAAHLSSPASPPVRGSQGRRSSRRRQYNRYRPKVKFPNRKCQGKPVQSILSEDGRRSSSLLFS